MQPVRRVEEQWGTVISVDVRDPIDRRASSTRASRGSHVSTTCSAPGEPTPRSCASARGELAVDGRAARRCANRARAVRSRCGSSPAARSTSRSARTRASRRARLAPARSVRPGQGLGGRARRRPPARRRRVELLRQCGRRRVDARASPRDAAGWRVGIQHPWERDRVAAVLDVSDAAVATSGRYERGDHVVDPSTGRPATGLASVTVVGPDLALADALRDRGRGPRPDDGMRWLASRGRATRRWGSPTIRSVVVDAPGSTATGS